MVCLEIKTLHPKTKKMGVKILFIDRSNLVMRMSQKVDYRSKAHMLAKTH